jgi:signal transduction histidine kinase/ActR/RegA family two-component response regulator
MTGPVRKSHQLAAACGLIACGVGATALTGWIAGTDALKALSAGGIVIKTNTAICLVCAGLSLSILSRPTLSASARRVARVLALGVAVVGAMTFSQHLFGWNLGIDEWLFREVPGSPATTSPNRMGPPASLAFPLIGGALLLLDRGASRRLPPPQALALAVMLIALVPLLGYVFGVSQLYGLARYTGIALHTAIALFLLGAGALFARPAVGVPARFLAGDLGGVLLRRMIPAAVLLPLLLGLGLAFGQRAQFYGQEFAWSLLIFSFIVLFSWLTWRTAAVVHRHAAARQRAEQAERELRERLAATLESERAARALAERANRLKDEFLASVSHELRTPLAAVSGWVQLLAGGQLGERDARRAIEAIDRNARLQEQLVNDLLDMSRIEAGTLRLDVEEVDLAGVIDAALAAAAPAIEARGLQLERRLGAVPIVRGDPARLQQVFSNLISNAVKFTPRGGRVTVTARADQGGIEVAVADTGVGIRADFLEHVFDRFRQADGSTTRRHGGLGLGLSIARQLLEMHGGMLTAQSEGEGLGATFTVRIPAQRGVSAPDESVGGPLLEPAVLEGTAVLVVDDQLDVCELVERSLVTHGARVRTASSVEAAIGALETDRFDVLVSDIGMPGQDGYDLIHYIRARGLDLPALALTAFARSVDIERALAAGFQRHLTKPVSPDRIVQVVAALKGGRSAALAATAGAEAEISSV